MSNVFGLGGEGYGLHYIYSLHSSSVLRMLVIFGFLIMVIGTALVKFLLCFFLLLLLLLHLTTHPTKCYKNSKVRALSEKTNSEQVRLQVFRKSRWTNRQVPQFDRQLIPTAGTSNSKGSQTPIRPVASETFKTLEH